MKDFTAFLAMRRYKNLGSKNWLLKICNCLKTVLPFFKPILFIYFVSAGSLLLCRLSLLVASRDCSLAAMHRLLIAVASLVEHRL